MKVIVLAAVGFFVASVGLMSGQTPPHVAVQERHTPDGTFCTQMGVMLEGGGIADPTHPCHCKRMTHSKDCEGYVEEDNRECSNACHKEKCRCPVICKDPVPPGDPEEE